MKILSVRTKLTESIKIDGYVEEDMGECNAKLYLSKANILRLTAWYFVPAIYISFSATYFAIYMF